MPGRSEPPRAGWGLTDEDLAAIKEHDAILLGAVGGPSVPSGVAGAPGASFGTRGYNAPPSPRSARRPAPSSQSSTSPAKVIGWILFVLLFIVIRALNG